MTTEEEKKRVYVFVDEACVVAEAGQFDEWCAFESSEFQAQMKIYSRYKLGDRRLKLVRTFEDRRRASRRGEDRRANE